MRIKSLLSFNFTAALILVTSGFTTSASATTYACNNFASQLCAPITTVSMSLDSNKPLATNSATTFIGTKVSKLNFSINAGSDNASKSATLQFFDISAGLKFIVRSNDESACAAGNTIQKECAITLDSDGKKSFYVTLLDAEPGMHFQYKYVGPEAWTSATKSVTFSVKGKVPVMPEACVANTTQIWAPVTNLSFNAGAKHIEISKPDKSGNFKASMPASSDLLEFNYKSSSDYAFKYLYVDFYNLASGLSILIDTSTNVLGAGCDRNVAPARGCYIQLNSKGSASFIITLNGGAAGKTFNFKLNGAGYTSKYVVVTMVKKKK
jgi:hypothetical protein